MAGASIAALAVAVVLVFLFRPLPSPKVTSYTQITNDARSKGFLATDGARIYFDEEVGGRPTVHQVSATGGEGIIVPTTLKGAWLWDISPNHAKLLVTESEHIIDAPLWEVPLRHDRQDDFTLPDSGKTGWGRDGRRLQG